LLSLSHISRLLSCAMVPVAVAPQMHYVNLLRHNDITPFIVFDGAPLPMKRLTNERRRADRQAALDRGTGAPIAPPPPPPAGIANAWWDTLVLRSRGRGGACGDQFP
jgi:hypothetical protein